MTDFADRLTEVKTAIEQLRTSMSEGNPGTFDTLGPLLEKMNAEMQALPKDKGQAFIEPLLEIDRALAELSSDFTRQREEARAGLEHIVTRLKAGTAYAKSAAAIPSKTDDSV